MYPYPPPPPRNPTGSHPSLGAFLGLVFLGLAVPYALAYGLMGLAGVLMFAGVLAGAVARGGARMGAGAGARAAGFFMLLLLLSYAVILLANQGFIDLGTAPEMGRLVPYVTLMEGLWNRMAVVMQPVLNQLLALTGGDIFVELLLRISLPAIGAAVGGALAGAVVGRPAPRPIPMAMASPYPPYPGPYFPGYPGAMPQEQVFAPAQGMLSPEPDYLCPWCGLRVLPDMVKCWNCDGALGTPPPPPGF